jgi:Tfp pilus assembly protein PilE
MKQMKNQKGISIFGLIFVLAIVACLALLGLQVVPSYMEYLSVKNAIKGAKTASTNPTEIRKSFDKHAEVGYIDSIKGSDLTIIKNGEDVEISFAYDKKIHIVGPASLLLEFEGTTANGKPKKAKSAAD